MFRFIALTWTATNAEQQEAAQRCLALLHARREWTCALNADGLAVLVTGDRLQSSTWRVLPGRTAVILGTAFENCDPLGRAVPVRKAFTKPEVDELAAGEWREVVHRCWGRYVLFAHDNVAHRSYVVRDPLGGLPCYRTMSTEGLNFFFSAVEDCLSLGLTSFSINWDFVGAWTCSIFPSGHATAICEISQVLPGEHVTVSDVCAIRHRLLWDPFDIAHSNPTTGFEEASAQLRHTARACIQAWAACYDGILHKLSGGLDSSIVLACLRDAPGRPATTCLNYFSPGADGDERNFARLVTDRLGFELVEWPRQTDVRLHDMLEMQLSPLPSLYLASLQGSRDESSFARQVGATSIWGGQGGDQLFYQAQAPLAVADYFKERGLEKALMNVVLDAARLSRCSVWRVIVDTAKQLASRARANPLEVGFSDRKLVAGSLLDTVRKGNAFLHPIFERSGTQLPGKVWHALGLVVPQDFYDPLGRPDDPEPLEPLLSQPLVEVCLRTPTHLLITGGWDRATARHAFRSDLPSEIVRRRSKGGMDENAREILYRNIDAARELLLDGHLVGRGMLDRDKVAEVLSGRPTRVLGAMAELFDHLSLEAWTQRWSRARNDQPGVGIRLDLADESMRSLARQEVADKGSAALTRG